MDWLVGRPLADRLLCARHAASGGPTPKRQDSEIRRCGAGCAGEGKAIGQIFLAPPTAEALAAAFKLKGAIVPAPEIALAALATGAEGYTLAALVPLSLLEIPAGATVFRLEGVATARTASRSEHRRASLFYATDNACSDSAGFGIVHPKRSGDRVIGDQ